jgi:two-component system sensor kinase FixL
MSYITIIWSTVAACSVLLALMYGLVWAMDRKATASLAFAFEALAIVGTVVAELKLMNASTPAEWGELIRWSQIAIGLRFVSTIVFIRLFFGTGRDWLMWTIIVMRLGILITGFIVDPNFNYAQIDSIEKISFLGEQVTVVGHAVPRSYQWIATFSIFLLLIFVVDASVQLWRTRARDARRKALVIGGATFVSVAIATTYTQLMILAELKVPVLLSPPYLIMLAAMTFEVSRDTLRASRLTRELRASESRLDLAASAAGLALWSWNVKSNRLWISARARALFGLSDGDPIAIDGALSMIDAADSAQVIRAWREAMASGAEVETIFRLRPPDGPVRTVLARGRSEMDAGGRLVSVQGVLRDVTEQTRAREENEELRRELAHAGRVSVVGTLSSSLIHELGQPLGAILANAEAGELLLGKQEPDLVEVRKILADIVSDDLRASDVINGLRKFLKRRELEFAPTSVERLIESVATLVRTDAIARDVHLEWQSDHGLPPVQGDKVHLSQVLINLLINGMDAVANQPPNLRRVRMHAGSDGNGNIEMTVRDSGVGIEPSVMARIFDPFFTTKPSGMGLGLAVSLTIVTAHGGKLWAENSPDGGTIFRVQLPAFASAA